MTSLTLLRRIAARPTVVFDALATPEGMRGWWGPDAGPVVAAESDLRAGGHFRVQFRLLDGSEHECSGEFIEVEPPLRLAMTWQWRGNAEDSGVSQLAFELRPIAEGTELTLIHSRLQDEETRDGHAKGWTGSLDKLEAMFATVSAKSGDQHR